MSWEPELSLESILWAVPKGTVVFLTGENGVGGLNTCFTLKDETLMSVWSFDSLVACICYFVKE